MVVLGLKGLGCAEIVQMGRGAGESTAVAPPGGIPGATGYRYFTISVSNVDEITDACAAAGRKVVVPVRELRAGITISIVEDPDGNWVEFLKVG